MQAFFDLTMSEAAQPLLDAVKKHIQDNVVPIMDEFERVGAEREKEWAYAPEQLALLDGAKQKAKESGFWNFFLPDADTGEGRAILTMPTLLTR